MAMNDRATVAVLYPNTLCRSQTLTILRPPARVICPFYALPAASLPTMVNLFLSGCRPRPRPSLSPADVCSRRNLMLRITRQSARRRRRLQLSPSRALIYGSLISEITSKIAAALPPSSPRVTFSL